MLTYLLGDTNTEVVIADVLWRFPDKTLYYLHGIAAVALEETVAATCLRCGTVDDGNEIRSDDDSVLAFFLWVLRNDVLLYNFHYLTGLMGDRVMVALGIAS